MEISIGVSARHVHIKKEDFEALFGSDVMLEPEKELTQPGQFASNNKVTIQTEKGSIPNVRILGPFRSYTQVELSLTDAYKLGLKPPVRSSGDLKGSSPITLVGPKGSISLEEGVILANRHIHITKEERIEKGLENEREVRILIGGEKGGILDHVWIKEAPNSYFELHLDTDDANAHLIQNGDKGEILIEQ